MDIPLMEETTAQKRIAPLLSASRAPDGPWLRGYLLNPEAARTFNALENELYVRADRKWEDYRAHCDRLFFAFTQDLPCDIFPKDTGLIVADAYGAHLHCEAPEHRLPAPTRKLMTVRFGIAAATRINRLVDPQGHAEF